MKLNKNKRGEVVYVFLTFVAILVAATIQRAGMEPFKNKPKTVDKLTVEQQERLDELNLGFCGGGYC